jgi:hypothetical protein
MTVLKGSLSRRASGASRGGSWPRRPPPCPRTYYSEDCLGVGVPLWPLPNGHHWYAEEVGFERSIVLDGVEDETVIIDVWSDTEASEKVLPEAKEVLDTVEWEGS